MTFKDQMTSDLRAIFDAEAFGETVVYSTVDGAEASTVALIDVGNLIDPGAVGSNAASVATIRVMEADVTEPQVDDLATVGEKTWRVVRILANEGGVWVLEAVRDERMGAR